MKFLLLLPCAIIYIALLADEIDGFSPSSLAMKKSQLTTGSYSSFVLKNTKIDESGIEEEVEQLFQEAMAKSAKLSKLTNERGTEYAPWMNIRPEDEMRIRGAMRDKAEARRRRELEERTTRGSLLKDSTNQELSGTGLKGKLIDDSAVELEWATGSEKNTAGFLVKRRTAKSGAGFEVIASYENYGPLASKGLDGGVYRYLDESIEPGNGYLYRITECDKDGEENDLSQCLIEVQTSEEQAGTKIALAGFIAIAVAALASSLLLDPMQ